MNNSNIVLIGMPGSGKSTIGVLLAKTLKKPFIDVDLVIQYNENRFLQDIIDSDGLETFLKIEEKTIADLKVENHVIATGGSAVYKAASMSCLEENGLLIYLQLTVDEIQSRINNILSRGIAINKGQSLLDLYNERVPLYEKYADITVNCSNKSMECIVSEIKDILKKQAD